MSALPNYYADLLILQYLGKPKAYAMIEALVTPVIMDQLPVQVMNAFSLDFAVGVQLDVLGKYIGVSRVGSNFSGPVTLSDAEYRTLLRVMIVRNSLSADQSSIQAFIHQFFDGVIQEFDHQTMRLSYFYEVAVGTNNVAEFFIKLGQLPKPLGVRLSPIVYAVPSQNFFALRTVNYPGIHTSPFNTVTDYQTTFPWLSVANGISV